MTASVVNGKETKIYIEDQKGEIRKMEKLKKEKVEKEQKNKITEEIKGEKGITLLALILTVVIMIILAAVTINVALGEGGLVDQAKWAAEQTANSTKSEQEQLEELEQEFANLMAEDSEIAPPEPEEPSVSESESYVGYYADVDGNGTVDGVIYADLAIGGSGEWNPGNNSDRERGKYTIPEVSNFKKYKVSKSGHSDDFGTKDVLTVSNSSGNERFYVMALDDVDNSQHCWYDSAYGNMDDYASTTSTSFGSGKQNTKNMIAKWNSSAYGSQNGDSSSPDIWGLSAVQSKINANPAWYVPSKEEWAAFGDNLAIDSSSSEGLSSWYWSSSQYNTNEIWYANFDGCFMGYIIVNLNYSVRLGATF